MAQTVIAAPEQESSPVQLTVSLRNDLDGEYFILDNTLLVRTGLPKPRVLEIIESHLTDLERAR